MIIEITTSAPTVQQGATPLTMSTVQIAEATGKQHKHVIRDTRAMLATLYGQGNEDGPDLDHLPEGVRVDIDARKYTSCIHLDEEHSVTLVTGYDVRMRKAVVDFWVAAKRGAAAAPSLKLPDFSDPVAAARAWADQFEARQIAERTKAEIGTRREATAMNTASQAVKRVNQLKIEMDRSRQYATVKRMSMLYHGEQFSWRELKHVSKEMNLPAIDVYDVNYGTVKGYHADVWREVYALDIPAGVVAGH